MALGKRSRVDIVVTCEHGGNRIPPEYGSLFARAGKALASHRGFDAGALALARELARRLEAPLVASTVSRLLIELNRSPGHRSVYSEFTRGLPADEKARLAARHYEPYRSEVEQRVRSAVETGARVVHFSSHSFTPVLDGEVRATDVGLLYDPQRPGERAFCATWCRVLGERVAPLRVRRNYPYRGYDDGLTTYLRRRFPSDAYLGIEIEVNQKHVLAGGASWRALRRAIVTSAEAVLTR